MVRTHVKVISLRTNVKEVWADLENHDTKTAIKRRVEQSTGIPAADQAVRMGGYNQLTVIDRKSNVLVGSYGMSMATQEKPDDGKPTVISKF